MKTIQDYVNEIKIASDADWKRNGYILPPPEFSIEQGKKYSRIVRTSLGSNSVHCFVDAEGNIYKASSWKVPAKGIRGNINNDKKPLLGRDYYR